MLNWIIWNKTVLTLTLCIAQSAGAVEYTECTSAEGIRLPSMSVLIMTLNRTNCILMLNWSGYLMPNPYIIQIISSISILFSGGSQFFLECPIFQSFWDCSNHYWYYCHSYFYNNDNNNCYGYISYHTPKMDSSNLNIFAELSSLGEDNFSFLTRHLTDRLQAENG